MNKVCWYCSQESKNFKEFDDKTVCPTCYYKLICAFCKPPKRKEDCPGHETTGAKNRFVNDEEFVHGTRFEFD